MAKLKIQKTYTGGSGYQASATIVVDSYANNQKLAANGVASSSGTYEGGVGGYTTQTIATIQPTVKVRSATATTGSIISQRGAHKFQVSDENTVNDESVTVGQTYRINSVGSTDWAAMGAGPNANTNDVFAALAAGAGTGTVQNVGICTLVNLATPTAANTMSLTCTAASINNANVANIGTGTVGSSTNRQAAYITWNAGDVVGGVNNFKVGQTINLTNSPLTGTVTLAAINSTTNIAVTLGTTQTVAANTTAFTSTFQASKINNKYVWDFLDAGTAESSTTGGFTGSENPNRYRYWFVFGNFFPCFVLNA